MVLALSSAELKLLFLIPTALQSYHNRTRKEMTIVKFRAWEFIVDKELTKMTYDKVPSGSPEGCDCNDCKNFVNSRETIYPEEIKKLLTEIGVDYKKESEICHYCRQDDGLHHYGGWFHFKGQFKGKDCNVPIGSNCFTFDLTPINDKFSIGFHYDSALTFFDKKENLVQIEFEAKIQWTIDKELESE